MTNYIDKLSKSQLNELLSLLNYSTYSNGFCCGTDKWKDDGYLVIHTYDHNYSSSQDYDDSYYYLSDFDVKYANSERLKNFYHYMINKFGENYKIAAIKHLTNKKETDKIKLIENIENQVDANVL